MIVFWSLVAALAVYRVAMMLAIERGPFDVFTRWQQFVFDKFQKPYNDSGHKGTHWFYYGITCPICLSFWLGWLGAAAVAFEFPLSVVEFALLALALSGAATALVRCAK